MNEGGDPHISNSTSPLTAGVVGRPILFFPAAILLGLVLDRLLPLPVTIPRLGTISTALAGILILAGLLLFLAGVRNFSRAETPLPTNEPTRVLVTFGVYRWTRNPIYLGFLLAFVGIGIVAQSPWVLAFAPALALMVRYGVIAREEAYLERRFGDAYRDYKSRVRRWL